MSQVLFDAVLVCISCGVFGCFAVAFGFSSNFFFVVRKLFQVCSMFLLCAVGQVP